MCSTGSFLLGEKEERVAGSFWCCLVVLAVEVFGTFDTRMDDG